PRAIHHSRPRGGLKKAPSCACQQQKSAPMSCEQPPQPLVMILRVPRPRLPRLAMMPLCRRAKPTRARWQRRCARVW
ncbi:MAG TPA: hypothetical protein DIC41_03280, partial [Alphaproteobacteria bacterium]|nr:hypothetical protein [Alphaproteobacteria bacterium]